MKIKILIILSIIFFSPFLTNAQNYTSVSSDFQFTRNLGLGNRGQDVENLQCILGVTPLTGYYGPITSNAVLQFQNNHAAEILTPVGLTSGTGYFGLATRTYLNTQIRNASSAGSVPTCPTYVSPIPTTQPNQIPNQYPQTPPQQSTSQPNQNSSSQTLQQLLPLIPLFNQNGSLSYFNPNSQPVVAPNGQLSVPNGIGVYDPYRVNTLNQPPVVTNNTSVPHATPPPSGSSPAFYTTTANLGALQQYQRGGNCSQYLSENPGCRAHPTYYANHLANPKRDCAIHPNIAYLEMDLLPRAFPWVKFTSDCRTAGGGSHEAGLALDLGSKTSPMTEGNYAQGDQLVIWAQRPENVILGITHILYKRTIHVYDRSRGAWSRPQPYCAPENPEVDGDDPCHYTHVHFGLNW